MASIRLNSTTIQLLLGLLQPQHGFYQGSVYCCMVSVRSSSTSIWLLPRPFYHPLTSIRSSSTTTWLLLRLILPQQCFYQPPSTTTWLPPRLFLPQLSGLLLPYHCFFKLYFTTTWLLYGLILQTRNIYRAPFYYNMANWPLSTIIWFLSSILLTATWLL